MYPSAREYFSDFFDSINSQSFKSFDLILVNDGIESQVIEEIIIKYKDLNIIELSSDTSSPIINRTIGLNYIFKKKYEYAVFGDIDDFFKQNRVEVCLSKLQSTDIVVNELDIIIDGKIKESNYLSNRINNNNQIQQDFIIRKNIFGLSNTAMRVNDIFSHQFPKDLIAFDWYFFTLCFLEGYKSLFTNETSTLYRMHTNNLVGLGNLTQDSLTKELKVKLKHYSALKERYKEYNQEYLNIIDLIEMLESKTSSENSIPKKIDFPVWWEQTNFLEDDK